MHVANTSAFIVNIICQITIYIGKTNALNLFTISYLSVTLESLKYLVNDLFVLCLGSISFIILHVYFISDFK